MACTSKFRDLFDHVQRIRREWQIREPLKSSNTEQINIIATVFRTSFEAMIDTRINSKGRSIVAIKKLLVYQLSADYICISRFARNNSAMHSLLTLLKSGSMSF
jgi:hypothetical protein